MHASVGVHEGEPWSLGHIFGGQAGAGRLPAELLFSDRDFTDADYETLLALDDSIVKKGATASCFYVHWPLLQRVAQQSLHASLAFAVNQFDRQQAMKLVVGTPSYLYRPGRSQRC